MSRKLYPSLPIVGVGAIILSQGKLLLEKRGHEPARGRWSIPGGVVELGERLKVAVVRETKEETGLDVEVVDLVGVVDQIDLDDAGKVKYHFVIVDFYVKVVGGELQADSDADELRWVPLEEVEGYDLTASFRRFFVKNKGKFNKAAQENG
jgi:8-oxo-dGTP diphosphatase